MATLDLSGRHVDVNGHLSSGGAPLRRRQSQPLPVQQLSQKVISGCCARRTRLKRVASGRLSHLSTPVTRDAFVMASTDIQAPADVGKKLFDDQQDSKRKGQKAKAPRIKSERRKSFELALERGSSQELLQTQPEGAKEVKGDFQVRGPCIRKRVAITARRVFLHERDSPFRAAKPLKLVWRFLMPRSA